MLQDSVVMERRPGQRTTLKKCNLAGYQIISSFAGRPGSSHPTTNSRKSSLRSNNGEPLLTTMNLELCLTIYNGTTDNRQSTTENYTAQ